MDFVDLEAGAKRVPSPRWSQRDSRKVHNLEGKSETPKISGASSDSDIDSDSESDLERRADAALDEVLGVEMSLSASTPAKSMASPQSSEKRDASFATASLHPSSNGRRTSAGSPRMRNRGDMRQHMATYFESTRRASTSRGHTFEKITKIETARRALFIQTKNAGALQILTSFSGTLLPYVLMDPLFWFSFVVYGVFRAMAWAPQTKDIILPQVTLQYISITGGFLSFFLTFFTSQSYSRFIVQYNKIMQAKGAILNIAMLCKANYDWPVALRMMRWLNACHLLAYVGLSDVYDVNNFFLPLCRLYGILSARELERIASMRTDVGSVAYREILTWVTDENFKLVRQKVVTDKVADVIWKEIVKLRENLASFFENEDQPIPFIYIHLLYMIALLYLPLFAYSVAVNVAATAHGQQHSGVEFIGVIIVFLNNLFVLGMRDLGHILQEPFGDYLQDMCVIHFVTYTFQMSRRILLGDKMGEADHNEEMEMESRRPMLGPGFVLTPQEREARRKL